MASAAEPILVPARQGRAQPLRKGQAIRVINTHGSQVVDTWAFSAENFGEFMSMEHTRSTTDRMIPAVGESFLTNCRRPILTIMEDTSPGVHDTLNAACDVYRYRLLGHEGYHDNCTDNLAAALDAIGKTTGGRTPCPFNMFQNRPWGVFGKDRRLYKEPPLSKPGDSMTLRAEMDCIVVFSACPQDMNATNGGTPKDVHYVVLG